MKKKILIISIFIIAIVCLIIPFTRFVSEYLYVNTTYKFKQYADTTYINSIDSVILNFSENIEGLDSLVSSMPNFKDGFYTVEMNKNYYDIFRRSRYKDNNYSTGEFKNRKKVGRWKYYHWIGSEYPFEERNYNNKGKLHGPIISYGDKGQIRMIDNYKNGELSGIQSAYHFNGKLAYQYEFENMGFVNEFMSLNEKGDTLYYVDLTADGTGYVKKYDEWSLLQWEGAFVNKKSEGYHIYYSSDGVDEPLYIEHRDLYQSDSLIKRTYYPRINNRLEYDADSNIWYLGNEINEYWKDGKIIKTIKE